MKKIKYQLERELEYLCRVYGEDYEEVKQYIINQWRESSITVEGNQSDRPQVVAVDFDGTIVKNVFPGIGEKNKHVIDYMKEVKESGAEIILWTTRQNEKLDEALSFLDRHNIPYDYVNENVPWLNFDTSDKIFADIYLDDRAKNPFGKLDDDMVRLSTTDEIQEVVDYE